MFASLSRGSPGVRQAYICSSCLSNVLTHAPSLPLLTADRGRRAVFYSTSTDAQPDNEASEPAETPKPKIAEDGKIAGGTKSARGEQGGRTEKARDKRISSSGEALKALQKSLARATQVDATSSKEQQTNAEKSRKASAFWKQRASRREKLAESKRRKEGTGKAGTDDDNTHARPSTRSLEEEPATSRKQRTLGLSQSKKAESRSDDHEAKKVAVTASKSKKSTSKATKTLEKSPLASSEKTPLLVRRLTSHEPAPREEQVSEDAGKLSKDVIEPQHGIVSVEAKNAYHAAIPGFFKRYPSIFEKVRLYQENAQQPQNSRKTTYRRVFVELLQTGQLTPNEKQVTLKLLRNSMVRRHASIFSKPSPPLATRGKRSSVAVRPENTRNAAATSAASSRGLKDSSTIVKERAMPGPISAQKGTTKHEIKTIDADELQLIPIDKEPLEVPSLAYGLERVLFNPGVYHLQDPRSRVFNFDPYLQTIMPVSEFDFNALKKYITSSRDTTLLAKAKEEEKKYTGSTSSMTSALGHFHFLLSQWRPINTGILSQMFPVEFNSFTALQRGPVSVFLRYRDGTYAIDADKEYDDSNILMMLGKSMEKLLTLSTDDFEKYRKANSDQISEEQRNESEPFHYTTIGDFLLRSQLDAHDPRLPGTGMFDLKTRAVISVRMDTKAFEEGRGYQIRGRHGEWESFEREYYDMIRSAFLKYSLQVRMGRMDGIFVAFHNTERIFGFQYISLPEMDYALHGTDNVAIGDSEFKLSLELLNRVLDRATAKFPKQSMRLHFETRDGVTPFMYIFAEPVAETKIEKIQATNKRKIEEFEREVLGVTSSSLTEEEKEAEWAKLRAKVEEEMQSDELGLESPDQAKDDVEFDELVIQEQLKAGEAFASTAIEEDGEENEEDEEDEEDVLVEELEDDDEHLDEEEGREEEILEEEENDEESEETNLDDNNLNQHDTAEENLEDDLEETEETRISEEHNLAKADEALRDDVEEIEEQHLDDHATTEENTIEHLEQAEKSESLQEQDLEEHKTAEDIIAQDLEEADRLEESADEEETAATEEDTDETPVDENEPSIKKALANLTSQGILSGPTVKEAMIEEASKHAAITRAMDEERPRKKQLKHTTGVARANEPAPELNPLLAMTLVIRNKVNDQYVTRPEKLESHDKWDVEYALSEVPKLESAHRLYKMTKVRRARALTRNVDLGAKNAWNNTFIANIKKMSEKGRVWREKQDKIEKQLPLKRLEVKNGKTMNARDRDVHVQAKKED